ncbi:17562_t:CDS:2, partial [Funneliformis geosporum]
MFESETSKQPGINHLNNHQYNDIRRHGLGRMDQICTHCNAKFWINEKDKSSSLTFLSFAVCCASGKVNLPPSLKPPSYLLNLYTSSNSIATSFHKNIRGYNNLLACISFGANINKEFQKQGISNFQIHGQ